MYIMYYNKWNIELNYHNDMKKVTTYLQFGKMFYLLGVHFLFSLRNFHGCVNVLFLR
jgi:hypothetical protein